jgi:carbamoyl-phosphate synthase large subunit
MPPSRLKEAWVRDHHDQSDNPERSRPTTTPPTGSIFEPLTSEKVLEFIEHRARSNGTLHGVIVQFGGQTPLKLGIALEKAKVPIHSAPRRRDRSRRRTADRFKLLFGN